MRRATVEALSSGHASERTSFVSHNTVRCGRDARVTAIGEDLPDMPPGRLHDTDDAMGAVRFLPSPAADLVSGHRLLVGGGQARW